MDYEAEGYRFYNGHTFKYFNKSKAWTEAKTACEELGGHLATSTSAEENDFLIGLLKDMNVWLGGTYDATEGVWQWITGETWDYDEGWFGGQLGSFTSSSRCFQVS